MNIVGLLIFNKRNRLYAKKLNKNKTLQRSITIPNIIIDELQQTNQWQKQVANSG